MAPKKMHHGSRFDIDLESVYWFTIIVERQSFVPVVQVLRVPKSTLSRRIAALERALGSQLLMRNPRSVKTTEFGRRFYPKAKAILGAVDESRDLSDQVLKDPEGPIRIAAGVEFGTMVLSPLIAEFVERYPKVIFDLDLGRRTVDLAHEGYDLAIRVGPQRDSALLSRSLGNVFHGLFASPEYLRENGNPKTWGDLKKHKTLLFTGGHYPKGWKLLEGKRKRVIHLSPRMRSDTHWVLKDASLKGLGICFIPKFMVHGEVTKGLLVPVLPQITSWELPIHVLFPRQKFMPAKIRAFIDFVVDALKRNPVCNDS